jgi:hypothetical protein
LLPDFVNFIERSSFLTRIAIHFKRFNLHWPNGAIMSS